MTEVNVSAGLPYHTQVNNRYVPLSSCNTTSAIMWLLDCHVPFWFPASMQPEDYLTQITESDEAYAYMKKVAPWAWEGSTPRLPPRQVHACLAWAINRLAKREVARFRTNVTYQELASELARGRAAILSTTLTQSGHVVTLVGVRSRQSLEELRDPARVRLQDVAGWTVDDPYGDWRTGYSSHRGNDVPLTHDELDRFAKKIRSNEKWAHLMV